MRLWDNPLENLTILSNILLPIGPTPEQVHTVSMYQPTSSYDDDFPALQEQVKHRVRTLPQVHNPQGVNVDGRPK